MNRYDVELVEEARLQGQLGLGHLLLWPYQEPDGESAHTQETIREECRRDTSQAFQRAEQIRN